MLAFIVLHGCVLMIDKEVICIPFRSEYLIQPELLFADEKIGRVHVDMEQVSVIAGVRMSAHDIEFAIDGDHSITGLSHPYESLPSSFSSLAVKIRQGGRFAPPFVEIKASPAKLLQGHNVCGPTCFRTCSMEMMGSFIEGMPDLADMLNLSGAWLSTFDATFSTRMKNNVIAEQVHKALRTVESGQTKYSRSGRVYESTNYWNEKSTHRSLKEYLKWLEVEKEIAELCAKVKKNPHDKVAHKRLDVLQNPKLIDWTTGLMRFEASIKSRYMRDLVLTHNDIDYQFPSSLLITEIVDFQKRYERETGRNLIYDVWKASFKDIFSALEGQEMNIYDDEDVMQKLKHEYHTITPKGNISYSKAQRVFGFYRRLVNEGYDGVRSSMSVGKKPSQTFYRQLDLLLDVGISKAQLQNLTGEGTTNVVPMIRFVDVDFSNQYPDWYVEPVSRFVA